MIAEVRDERGGGPSVEAAVLAVVIGLLIAFAIAGGQLVAAEAATDHAARSAARVASLQRRRGRGEGLLVKRDEEIMDVLDAFDLAGRCPAAAELPGWSPRVARRVALREAGSRRSPARTRMRLDEGQLSAEDVDRWLADKRGR